MQGQGAVEVGGGHVRIPQGLHLILHEGDQGRDHHGQAGEEQAGDLIAEGLAAARGHDGQGVPAVQHIAHHLGLEGAEGVVAEDLFEQGAGRVQGGGHGGHGRRQGFGGHGSGWLRRRFGRLRTRPIVGEKVIHRAGQDPAGELGVAAQFAVGQFIGPPPVGQGDPQERTGGDHVQWFLKAHKGEGAPAVRGGIAIEKPFWADFPGQGLVRRPKGGAVIRHARALGDVERALFGGLEQSGIERFRSAGVGREMVVDEGEEVVDGGQPPLAEDREILGMGQGTIIGGLPGDLPHIAHFVVHVGGRVGLSVGMQQTHAASAKGEAADAGSAALAGLGDDHDFHGLGTHGNRCSTVAPVMALRRAASRDR